MKVLFLDIDGVLTTRASRNRDYWCFGPAATVAMRYLLKEGRPDICVVHSTWRKLPAYEGPPITLDDTWWMYEDVPYWDHDLWRAVCHRQGIDWTVPLVDAPYTYGTHRGVEIRDWMSRCYREKDSYVVLDDQMYQIEGLTWDLDYPRFENVLCVTTDDTTGLTLEQAHKAVHFWNRA